MMRTTLALAVALVAVAWASTGDARAATTCTWAGTPAAPTGTFTISPGLTNLPSAGPLKFVATGSLSGADSRCRGQMKFVGQLDAGSTCAFSPFEGTVQGLPGVARWWGRGSLDVPSYLYDRAGNLVGVENAQIMTSENLPQAPDCLTPRGFTGPATFSSNVILFN